MKYNIPTDVPIVTMEYNMNYPRNNIYLYQKNARIFKCLTITAAVNGSVLRTENYNVQ